MFSIRVRANMESEIHGEQVYCFKDNMKFNVYKIGKTTQGWEKRLKELNRNTGSVENNALEATLVKRVTNCHEAEAFLHKSLKEYRVTNRKEFFHIDINTIKYWFDRLNGQYIINRVPSAPPQHHSDHMSIQMEVPTAAVLREPFIVRDWPQQSQQCFTKDVLNKALCIVCAIGTIIILVTFIIFVAKGQESE